MPRPLSPATKRKVLNLLFSHGRREVVRRMKKEAPSISGGTVTSIESEFEEDVHRKGLERASEEWKVSDIVEPLKEYGRYAAENKISITDMLPGAHIAKSLRKMGVDPSEADEFVEELRALHDSKIPVAVVLRIRDTAVSIATQHGISPEEAIGHFDRDVLRNYGAMLGLRERVDGIINELVRNQAELDDLQGKLNEQLAEYRARTQAITDYATLRSRGVGDEMMISLNTLLTETNLSLDGVMQELTEYSHLQRTYAKLQEEVEGLRAEVGNLEARKKELEEAAKPSKSDETTPSTQSP